MKILALVLWGLLIFNGCYSQQKENSDIVAPNSAELGKYGQIPVSYFNGLPQINIPIYTVKCKDLNLPINLSYHASGNKTENHPSWVGLGWNLSAGGSISRIINGVRDDLLKENWASETHTNCGPSNEWSYYWGSGFPTQTWYQESFIQGIYNNRQVCGSNQDTQPDEFVFNFLDYSGSFYFVNEGGHLSIKFKSKDNMQFKIEPVFSTSDIEFDIFKNNPIHEGEYLKAKAYKTIVKLILTDKEGVKYEFGGDPISNIDFATSNGITIATSWHLSKIVSPLGSEITLYYKSDGEIIEKSKVSHFYADINFENPGEAQIDRNDLGINGLSISLIHPKYLLQIKTSNDQTIDFNSSRSLDLDYDDWDSDESNIRSVFTGVLSDYINPHGTVWNSDLIDSHYDLKLDQINISPLLKIVFRYVENENQRLKLDKLILASFDSDLTNDQTMQKYTFEYNPVLLPNFNERKSDNNGYYNNIDYSEIPFGLEYHNLMSVARQPVEEFMKAEILEKIHYPTGGVTMFDYQPHDYSQFVQPLMVGDLSFQLIPQTGIAGGLRIWRITSFPDENDQNKFFRKTFIYKNVDGSSSGILSGKPLYFTDGDLHFQYDYSSWIDLVYFHYEGDYFRHFYQYSQNPILPLSNTNGNHITYSRVVEKNEDESYTVFTFTNHDEYPDEVPIRVYTNNDGNHLFGEFTSREIERGLLKSTEKFNDANRLIEKVVFTYNQNINRYNNFIKKVDQHFFYHEFRFCANKIYTFTPYLEKEEYITYNYDEDGTAYAISTVKDYEYKDNLISQIINTHSQSDDLLKTKFQYPNDIIYKDCLNSYLVCMELALRNKIDRDEECFGYASCLEQSNNYYIQDTTNCGQNYRYCQAESWLNLNKNDGLVLKRMISNNIVSEPIEIREFIHKDNMDFLINSSISKYKLTNDDIVIYDKKYILKNNEPLEPFPNCYLNSDQNLEFNSKYEEKLSIDRYDTKFNATEILTNLKSRSAMIWGYNQLFLIAKIINSTLPESGHTSFENNELNGWIKYPHNTYVSNGFTGKSSMMVFSGLFGPFSVFSVGDNALNHSGYKASVWVKGNKGSYINIEVDGVPDTQSRSVYEYEDNQWHLIEVEFPRSKIAPYFNQGENLKLKVYVGAGSGSYSTYFDDLRFHPSDAQMTTYTYEPLIGVTSISNENNKPEFYIYDLFGRLELVKDFEGNSIKKNEYHYRTN